MIWYIISNISKEHVIPIFRVEDARLHLTMKAYRVMAVELHVFCASALNERC
jgi:hypothetical protein